MSPIAPTSGRHRTRYLGHRLTALAACLVELGVRLHPNVPAFLDHGNERWVVRSAEGSDLDLAHPFPGAFQQTWRIGRADAEEESQIDVAALPRDGEDSVRS
jgi:hypothetical protein